VVLFHLGTVISDVRFFGVRRFGRPFIWGDSGVPFFFVLSGFLIPWIHFADINRPAGLMAFVRKRLARIYPIYWIVFALAVFAAIWLPAPMALTFSYDGLTLLKGLLLLPQDPQLVDGIGAPVLVVAWSLQYEMCFYALVAASIVSRWLGATGLLLLCANFASCEANGCTFPRTFFANHCILLFAMGFVVAVLIRGTVRLPQARRVTMVAAALFVAFGLMESVLGHPVLRIDRRLGYGTLSALLIWGLVQQDLDKPSTERRRPGERWWLELGDASYVLYLVHLPLMVILCKTALWLGLQRAGVLGAMTAYVAILPACVAAAVALHRLLEKPLLRVLSGGRIERGQRDATGTHRSHSNSPVSASKRASGP
jgi:exopolysaccharide production protein ExoZ